MYSYLTDTNDVFRDINVAEIYNENEQARTLLKRASGDFFGLGNRSPWVALFYAGTANVLFYYAGTANAGTMALMLDAIIGWLTPNVP